MAELLVDSSPRPIEFAPGDLVTDVAQNVRMIITTPKGSVPLDRDFGLDFGLIDQPAPRAKALLGAEIVDQVRKYEPRAKVLAVNWQEIEVEAMGGRLTPIVKIEVQDEPE
ncbi:GPW/gp25 family protein [Dethiosulfatarculus sandiegensis]|uniref:IraD/Gp25-like domain-containing protein n=1 Tax=Dethiosulfatarculus sandiegensis TaxID=1429043 RepID=A0A0D2JGY5_9BACT|nr:GPW/gp25 family protein [Dethiosulfatarculus sandiegensis]KIX14986.1 hypothetical protein X474_05760 [Dethiosulfatarculus sandiegensis]